MRLIQEQFQNPWEILVTCILLNRTQSEKAEPIIDDLLEEYPNPGSMSKAKVEKLTEILIPLGLSNRSVTLINMSAKWLKGGDEKKTDPIKFVKSLPGCGDYAAEAYRMFYLGERDFWPKDKKLALRMLELRLDPEVFRSHNSRIFLKLFRDTSRVHGLGITDQQSIGIVRIENSDFDKYFVGMPHVPVERLCQQWLAWAKYTPILEEEIMTIIAMNSKGHPIGKFATQEDADKVIPRGGNSVSTEDLTGMNLTELTTIYNALVGDAKAIKKFSAGKANAVKRTAEAMENFGNQPPEKPAKKTSKPKADRGPTSRDRVREFLSEGKEFTMDEVATLIDTSKSNASVTVNLLKSRPGNGYTPLVLDKTEGGKLKVTQASVKVEASAEA